MLDLVVKVNYLPILIYTLQIFYLKKLPSLVQYALKIVQQLLKIHFIALLIQLLRAVLEHLLLI
jgi:hypothetical protein